MIARPLAYETLQRNLEAALPSLPSTNRYIRASNCNISEGILRCEELRIYLSDRKLPMTVSLSEDATRIIDKVQYDPNTNQLIGFVLPINDTNGLPIPFKFPARNADDIFSHFSGENTVSSFLNVVVAQPLAVAPRFCLLIYGSDCRYSAFEVSNRWTHIISELKKVGIKVLTFASDSDPKYNRAMRELSKINKSNEHDWFACELSDGTFYIQDIIHIATKLRNFLLRLLRNKKGLPFGKNYVRLQHLHDLIDILEKKNHLLTLSTLYPDDRQNFKSVQRMCNQEVICSLKENVKGSEGTAQFLQIIRDVVDSFLDKSLTPLQRIRKHWYALFLIRIWYQFIVERKGCTLKDNFLTSNCYNCIEINAHSLVLILLYLKKTNQPELFLPHLYDSQPCEKTFRAFRSLTTAFSTITNCTVKEAISRLSKINFQNEITHTTSSAFVYPRVEKNSEQNFIHPLPTWLEIYNEIVFSKKSATITATRLGLINKRNENCELYFKCKINPHTSHFRSELNKQTQIKSFVIADETFFVPDLKNIKLKDFNGKLKSSTVDERSIYAEIPNATGKTSIVKKSSLCWLLRDESKKMSNDRLQRVKHCSKKRSSKKNKQSVIKHGARLALYSKKAGMK